MYSIWTQTVVAPFSLPFSIYRCSMDGDGGAELVATLPGIKPTINSTYVLIEINPNRALWLLIELDCCIQSSIGHVHLPIWRGSVIIVCEVAQHCLAGLRGAGAFEGV